MEEIADSMLVTRALMPSAFTCVQCHTDKKLTNDKYISKV